MLKAFKLVLKNMLFNVAILPVEIRFVFVPSVSAHNRRHI